MGIFIENIARFLTNQVEAVRVWQGCLRSDNLCYFGQLKLKTGSHFS